MTTPALGPVTAIYDVAAQARESIHHVNDPATEHLYKTSKRLQMQWRQMGSEDSHLMDALRKLSWITNLAVTIPIPLGHPGLRRFFSPDELMELLHDSRLSYPECSDLAQNTTQALEHTFAIELTEFGKKAFDLMQKRDRVALLSGRQWLNSSIHEYILSKTGRSDIRLIRPSDLRKEEVYDAIVIISPPSWIESQVRNAIRAKRRDIVTLSLFQRDSEQTSILPDRWKPITTIRRTHLKSIATPAMNDDYGQDFEFQVVAESLEITSVHALIQTQSSNTAPVDSYPSLGDAELIELVNGSFVLLPADGKTWTAEQDVLLFHVEQRNAVDIDPGDFVILRTRRDRELIAEIADKALGPSAQLLRQKQSSWKQTLLLKAKQHGLTGVARDLASLGLGSLATPMNVRRWTCDGFIRNQKYESWLTIMHYIGIETFAESLWDDMGKINDAHRQAGHTISTAIKTTLEKLSMNEIRDSMELPPMPELGDERLTLYLVNDRLGRVRDVRFTDMNKVFNW